MNAQWLISCVSQSILDASPSTLLLVKITAVLVAAWAAHWALARVNPRWRVLAWRATAVGLVALPTLGLLLPSLSVRVRAPSPSVSVERPVASPSQIERLASSENRVAGRGAAISTSANVSQTPTFEPFTAKLAKYLSWEIVLPAGWVFGFVAFALRSIVGQSQIRAMVARSATPPLNVLDQCERTAKAVGCRRHVEVLASENICSPLLCGLFRPVLLMPKKMCEPTFVEDLPGIFAHELTHLRSGDPLWNATLQALSVLLWFHPLAWRMRAAHLAACEMVCDAVSADYVGGAEDYCRTLARVAIEAVMPTPSAGIAMARTSMISRRLKLLRERVFHLPLRRRSVASFAVASLVLVSLLGSLRFALAETEEKPAVAAAAKESATPAVNSMKVVVLDPDGRPMPDAAVHASIWTEEENFKSNQDYVTNVEGAVQVALPKTYSIVRIWARKPSFATTFSHWEQNELSSGVKLPEKYFVQLERVVSAGGRIVDEEGKPIAGAKVRAILNETRPVNGDQRTSYDIWLATEDATAVTGADGRWRIDNMPNNPKAELLVTVLHPDYVQSYRRGELQEEAGVTTADFLKQTATLTLRRGATINGAVTDAEGKPIKNALVLKRNDAMILIDGGDLYGEQQNKDALRTDGDGKFLLKNFPNGETTLIFIATGYSPRMIPITPQKNMPPLNVKLERGKTIELRVVDESGKPVSEANVQVIGWGDKWFLNSDMADGVDGGIPRKTNKDGMWRWTDAPEAPVTIAVDKEKFAGDTVQIAVGEPRTIQFKSARNIVGSVTDAVTGKPIPQFTIIPVDVFRDDFLVSERRDAKIGKEGRLTYHPTRNDTFVSLRIEAKGYRAQTGPKFKANDAPSMMDFRMQPSSPVVGVVKDAAGKPVEKATVFMVTASEEAMKYGEQAAGPGDNRCETDSAGRFEFVEPGAPFAIFVNTEAGWALASYRLDTHDVSELRLQPWASLKGKVVDGGKPTVAARVYLKPTGEANDLTLQVNSYLQAMTDKEGRFEFSRVIPRSMSVSAAENRREGSSGPNIPLALKPGESGEVTIEDAGAVVQGKLSLVGSEASRMDYGNSISYLIRRKPGTDSLEILDLILDVRGTRRIKTRSGDVCVDLFPHWVVWLGENGAFRIKGVPTGHYDFVTLFYGKGIDISDPFAFKAVPITVTESDMAKGKLTLPEISVKTKPIAQIGDRPTFTFKKPDGTDGSLADYRKKFTVVAFWTSETEQRLGEMISLQRVRQEFDVRGISVLCLSFDDDRDVDAWQSALKRLELPWPQGRVTPERAGQFEAPGYWLLDGEGKIVAKASDLDKLFAAIEKATGRPIDKVPVSMPKSDSGQNGVPYDFDVVPLR